MARTGRGCEADRHRPRRRRPAGGLRHRRRQRRVPLPADGPQRLVGRWAGLGGYAKQIATGRPTPTAGWRSSPSAATTPCYHCRQMAPNGGSRAGGPALGGYAQARSPPAADADGRLEVFAIGGDNAVSTTARQTAPNGGPPPGWAGLGGYARADRHRQRRRRPAGGLRHRRRQRRVPLPADGPQRRLGRWAGLGGYAKQIATGNDADGRLEVFAIGGDNAVYHNWQTAPNGGWKV